MFCFVVFVNVLINKICQDSNKFNIKVISNKYDDLWNVSSITFHPGRLLNHIFNILWIHTNCLFFHRFVCVIVSNPAAVFHRQFFGIVRNESFRCHVGWHLLYIFNFNQHGIMAQFVKSMYYNLAMLINSFVVR